MTTHVLVITPDTEYAKRFPDADPEVQWRVECSDPAACSGWRECGEPHEVGGVSAADGPWDPPSDDVPWVDEDEFEFHGEDHTWRGGWGWTVEYAGCPVDAFGDIELPDDLPQPITPGRYTIDVEWDDTYCTVWYVGPGEAYPQPVE